MKRASFTVKLNSGLHCAAFKFVFAVVVDAVTW